MKLLILLFFIALVPIASSAQTTTTVRFDSIAFQSWKHDTLDANRDFVLCRTTQGVNDTLHIIASNSHEGRAITIKKASFNTGSVTIVCDGATIDNARDVTLASYRETVTIVRKSSTAWYTR